MIPSFRPSISFQELSRAFVSVLFRNSNFQKKEEFEGKLAEYLNVKHAICAPSGRWALYFILKSLNLKQGDEVIIPAFTYFAVPAAIIKLGLRPVFVDICPENLNIDVKKIEENITDKTRVIIPTYLCGFTSNIDEIVNIAKKYNIKVIEDCAQSLGAEYKNKKSGSWGDASYFTFGVTKNFTTLGAGMVAGNDEELANTIRKNLEGIQPTNKITLFFNILKAYIMKFATSSKIFPFAYFALRIFSYFQIDFIGIIFREKETLLHNVCSKGSLSSCQAELGIEQLKDLDRKNGLRMKIGLQLYESLKKVSNIRIPSLDEEAKNIFSGCPIFVKDKMRLKKALLNLGIDVSSGYMQNCAGLEVFKDFRKMCANSARAEEEILYLPAFLELGKTELEFIEKKLKQALEDMHD